MEQYLDYSETELSKRSAYWTAKEITQQPECWLKTHDIIQQSLPVINKFMDKVYSHPELRIILTGAGTSAFAGQAISPSLSSLLKRRVDAISSTDIVSNPQQCFSEDIPTLLVSFARSGNSPESVAAIDLANQCLSVCYHLVLTCNGEGKLYQRCADDSQSLAVLMPAETNDQSFAMTSSFSSMMLAAYSVLMYKAQYGIEIKRFIESSMKFLSSINAQVRDIANCDFSKVIYLGSGGLQGLAQESALKLLELTAGKVVACFDSPLGFRHGPKSIVDKETMVVVMISNDPYTRQYDLDLLAELRRDNIAPKVIGLTAQLDDTVQQDDFIYATGMDKASDVELLFPYMLFAQTYAFHRSIALNNTPDNPCPSGEVNRVVQGVTIHKLY